MKTVRVGNGRECLVPTSWAEGEEMLNKAMSYHDGRGHNLKLQAVCAQIAYGLFGEEMMAADPTQALCYLVRRICQRKGAKLKNE